MNRRDLHLTPCFVLSREKAASYRRKMGTSEQQRSKTNNNNNCGTLVQYLSLRKPQRGEYHYVNEATLFPFGAEDGSSVSFNENYLVRYIAQEVKEYKGPEKPWDRNIDDTMKIMRIYLRRVFDTAWNMELKSREMAKSDLQDYYDDDENEDDGHVASSSKRGKRRKLAKKKEVEVLEFDDDDDSDDTDNAGADANIFQECSDQDDADDDMDDLDAPYTQAITFDPDDFRMDDEGISNEPIRPGDVIEYYSPIYVAGDPRGLRRATVLSIDPKDSMPLVLSNGEGLPSTVKVKRVKVISGDDLLDHPGIFRLICMFKLRKLGSATAADGIAMETARFGSIMKKNVSKMRQKAEGDGFAPMDMLVNIKGVNDDVHDRNTTQTKRNASRSSSSRNIKSSSMSFSSSSDSSSNSSSSSDDEIDNLSSRQKSSKSTNTIGRRSIDNKTNASASKMKGKMGYLLMSESSSAESDDSSTESFSVNPGRRVKEVPRSKKSKAPAKETAGSNSRSYGIDLSLSSDDDSTVSNMQSTSTVRDRSNIRSKTKQDSAPSVRTSTRTPEPTSYPIQGLSRTISKSSAKQRSSPSYDLSSSEDSDDVEMNVSSKPFQIHNKNKAAFKKLLSGKSSKSSETINLHRKTEEQKDNAEDLPESGHEAFGWTRGSAGWKKTSVDGSGFSFARFK